MSTSKYHKRADTYEGPQMKFEFPSKEDLSKVEEPSELSGPIVQPYFRYQEGSPGHDAFSNYLIPPRSDSTNYFSHRGKEPSADQSYISTSHAEFLEASNVATDSGSSVSIPTEDNISYQITTQSPLQQDTIRDGSVHSQQSSQYESILNSSKSHSTKKNFVRKVSSIKRSKSTKSESYSLYRETSLKRSKAVKYKVGWLTRLRSFGIKIKTQLKSWRIIPKRRSFKFSRLSKKSLKKYKISMPLERENAQSISELRREINDWYAPKSTKVASAESLPLPPQTSPTFPMTPNRARLNPPLPPPHRIASNPSMMKTLESEITPSRYSYYDEEMFVGRPLDPFTLKEHIPAAPMSEINRVISDQSYPSNPRVIVDDESAQDDGFDSVSSAETAVDVDEEGLDISEAMLRQCWSGYLRKVISRRIESKLSFYRLSLSSDTEVEETDDEISDIISDYASNTDSRFEFDQDGQSLTSASSVAYSETDGSSYFTSEASTDYSSSMGVSIPEDILLYEREFISRQKKHINIKRSSTLPCKNGAITKVGDYQLVPAQHGRFISMIV